MTKPVFGPKRRPGRPPGIPMTEEQKELRRRPNPEHGEKIKQAWAEGRMEASRVTTFKPGQKPVNTGVACDERKRQKISATLQGIALEDWTSFAKPETTRLRESEEGRTWRKAVFERDNYTCQECGVRGVRLHADHILPFAFYPEQRFDLDNGRTLCVPCHILTDTYGEGAKKHRMGGLS